MQKKDRLNDGRDALTEKGFLRSISGPGGKAGPFFIFLLTLLLASPFVYFYFRAKAKKTVNQPEIQTAEKDAALEPVVRPAPVPVVSARRSNDNEDAAGKAIREGDYMKASVLLRAALKDSPESPALKKALAETLNRLAINEYNGGNFIRAKDLLTEAAGLSREPSFLENLANVQMRLNDLKGAAATLEPISSDPRVRQTLKRLYTELGNADYKERDVKAALEFYDKVLSLDPSDEYLKETVKKLRSEYDSEVKMGRHEVGHFIIKFEGAENAVAGNLIGLLLEEAYMKVGADLGYYPPDRIEALLYSRENFRDITQSPSWAGAIYDGRIKIPAGGVVEKTGELEKVIFHEYTHVVVHRLAAGRAPTWLNEGIAEYEEGKDASGYNAQLSGFMAKNSVTLKSLEGSFLRLSPDGARAAYLVSLSATGYIIREFGVSSVRRILENLGGGMPLDSSIRSAIYLSYDDLERSWLDSLKRSH